MESETYFRVGQLIGMIVGFITFVGCWIFCIANYGFLLGVGLGWLPSIITATIVGLLLIPLWGVVAFAIGAGIFMMLIK